MKNTQNLNIWNTLEGQYFLKFEKKKSLFHLNITFFPTHFTEEHLDCRHGNEKVIGKIVVRLYKMYKMTHNLISSHKYLSTFQMYTMFTQAIVHVSTK